MVSTAGEEAISYAYEFRLSGLPEDFQMNWDRPASSACRGEEKEKAYDEGLACAATGMWDSKSWVRKTLCGTGAR